MLTQSDAKASTYFLNATLIFLDGNGIVNAAVRGGFANSNG